jgi:hypothetical protein
MLIIDARAGTIVVNSAALSRVKKLMTNASDQIICNDHDARSGRGLSLIIPRIYVQNLSFDLLQMTTSSGRAH